MIAISTQEYDLDGHVVLRPDRDSGLRAGSRRLTRRATLDGGCSIVDQGFSHGDRTLDVTRTGIDYATSETLWNIFTGYALVNVSLPDGFFCAAIETLSIKGGDLAATILIKEKLA